MADLYLTPAEKYTAALGGFYYGDLPEPGTVYTQLIKDILDGSTPDKEPKNVLARFIYSLYISDLGDPYPRYELAKLLYWKLHGITPTKSGSVLTVTIDGKDDYMTINTDLSRLWYKVLFGSKTDIITEFPYTFNTMQTKLSDWELFGNTVQSGTPTPDDPIMPQGTGERTVNLFDKNDVENILVSTSGVETTNNNYILSTFISVDDMVTIFATKLLTDPIRIIRYDVNKQFISRTDENNANNIVVDDCAYVRINVNKDHWNISTIQAEHGTKTSYEPYGYKIPISSAGQTTPIYLGEVQTTRKIKKIEVEIKRVITLATGNKGGVTKTFSGGNAKISKGLVVCDRALPGDTSVVDSFYINPSNAVFVGSPTDTLDDLKSKYDGASLWYVLVTEETGVVNEPLMKIGGYADSVSMLKTDIYIPTIIGQNTLDVLTDVKPSSMRIEYTSADENKSRSKRISLLKRPLAKSIKA